MKVRASSMTVFIYYSIIHLLSRPYDSPAKREYHRRQNAIRGADADRGRRAAFFGFLQW